MCRLGKQPGDPYDEEFAIAAYEENELMGSEIIKLFQHLIDNGHAWTLKRDWMDYGKTIADMIKYGYCHAKEE